MKTEKTTTKTEGIYTITGKRWTKAGHDRMYITIDIEKDGHSYKELSKAAVGCLCGGDWWIDMTTGEIMHKEIPSKVSSWHVSAIEKLCAEMYADLADVQDAIVEPQKIEMTEDMAEDMGDMVAWDRAQMDTTDDVYVGEDSVGMPYQDLMVTYDVMDVVADVQEAKKSRIIKSVDDLDSWDIDSLKSRIHGWIMDTDYATDADDDRRWELTLVILKDLIKAGVYDMYSPAKGKLFIKDIIKKYTKKTAYYKTGCWDDRCLDTEIVYKGECVIEDADYVQLADHILYHPSQNLSQAEMEALKREWYVHLTESEVAECIKDLCMYQCQKYWTIYTQDTGNDLTFISVEAGYVTVTFDEFFEEVFTYISEVPQKDIMQYLKRTYTVA